MLILIFFVVWTLYYLSSDAWYHGLQSCRNPRFWVQLFTVALVLYTAIVVAYF